MAFAADHAVVFDRLDEELRQASAPMPGLFAKIVAGACSRIEVSSSSGKADRIDRLIAAGAFTDAALALIALELPAWRLRRLVYEDDEWHCALSRQLNLPATLDDTADASHEQMPLAILRALLQARRMTEIAPPAASPVPQLPSAAGHLICCDNFA
jgi:hypothetical protein